MGYVRWHQHDPKAALEEYHASLDLARKLTEADEHNVEAQRALSTAHLKIGNVFFHERDLKEAMKWYRAGLAIARQRADADQRDATAQSDLASFHEVVGDVLLLQQDPKAALEAFRATLDIYHKLVDADKRNSHALRGVAVAYEKMGNALVKLNDMPAAMQAYRDSLDIRRQLAAAARESAQAQRDLAVVHIQIGDALIQQKDPKAALESYHSALDTLRKLADADQSNVEAQTDLFSIYWKLGYAEKYLLEFDKALDWFTKGKAIVEPLRQAGKLSGQFANSVPAVNNEITACDLAVKSIADVDFALKQSDMLKPQLLCTRIVVWHKNGKHAEVAATADKLGALVDLPGLPPGFNLFNAAGAYALASTCADADEPTTEAHRAKAIALLKEARDKGFFKTKAGVDFAKRNPDFESLRQRDDYKALLAELEKDAK
jgi:tetratricopeptide (TPR) repeat protein